LRSFFSLPAVTAKIIVAIHWEALRLWLKGVRFVPRPNDPVDGSLATDTHSDYTSVSARGRR
jgi:DUF1365 family protein